MHYEPRVDSGSNRNEYQEYFQRERRAVRGADETYHLHVPIVLKYESINPHGTLRDCPDLHRDCFTLLILLIYTPIYVRVTMYVIIFPLHHRFHMSSHLIFLHLNTRVVFCKEGVKNMKLFIVQFS